MYSEKHIHIFTGFPGASVVKKKKKKAGDTGSNPVLGRSLVLGNSNPAQYSCLENSMDRRAWHRRVFHDLSDGACVHTFNVIYNSL